MSRPNISKAQMDVLVKAGGRRLKAVFTSGRVFGSRQTEGDNGWKFSSDPIHSPFVSDSCLSKRLVLLTHPSNEAKEEVVLKCISMHKKCDRKKIWGKDRGEASKRVRSGKTEMTDLLLFWTYAHIFLVRENTSTESNIPLLIQFNARKLDFFKHRLTEVSNTPYLVFM